MGKLQTVLIEGVFYQKEGHLVADRNGQSMVVGETLGPLVGEEIQIALHHLPPFPPNPKLWGGGCCLWQASGCCPAGHHRDPGLLLNVSGTGVLRQAEDRWWLDKFDGTEMTLPLQLLEGHSARVVAATTFSVEAMRGTLAAQGGDALDTLGVQATHLRDILQRIHNSGPIKEG